MGIVCFKKFGERKKKKTYKKVSIREDVKNKYNLICDYELDE